MKLKLSGKILLGFAVIILINLLAVGVIFYQDSKVKSDIDTISQVNATRDVIETLYSGSLQMAINVNEARVDFVSYVTTNNSADLDKGKAAAADYTATLTSLTKVAKDHGENTALEKINAVNTAKSGAVNQRTAMLDAGTAYWANPTAAGLKAVQVGITNYQTACAALSGAEKDLTTYFTARSKALTDQVNAETASSSKQIKTLYIVLSFGIVIIIVLSVIIALALARMLTKPIQDIVQRLGKLAEGDLTQKIENIQSGDELGTLAENFNASLVGLNSLIESIYQNSQTISATAQQLASSTQQVNTATQQVSSAVQEVAKGGEDLAQQTMQVSTDAKSLNEESDKGSRAAEEATTKMASLLVTVTRSAETVNSLGSKSQEIVKIVDTINSIASQTNLLALNAAIEAARAGEAGRGFAVVSDEVRKLAEESQNATKNIETLIQEITTSTTEAVESIDRGQSEVKASSEVVNQAISSLKAIGDKIHSIESSVDSVSAVAQQSASSSQQMSAGIQQTSSSMDQVASAAEQLAATSDELQKLLGRFKVSTVRSSQPKPVKKEAVKPTLTPSVGGTSTPLISNELMRQIVTTKEQEEGGSAS